MYLFLIIVFISIALGIWAYIAEYEDWGAGIFSFVVSFIILCALCGGISHSYISSYQKDFKWNMTLDKTFYIKTLNDNTNIPSGSFILGSGTISSQSYYFFYVQDNDSTFYLDKITTENCKIRETDIKNAYIKKFDFTLAPGQTDWLLAGEELRTLYFIYVPKNTIIINYNLDAQ